MKVIFIILVLLVIKYLDYFWNLVFYIIILLYIIIMTISRLVLGNFFLDQNNQNGSDSSIL